MAESDGRWEVVVLYSRAEQAEVEEIVAKLKGQFSVWYARDFPGLEWKRAVWEALKAAPCAVVLCGPKPGPWELREIDSALGLTRVIPVLLPGQNRLPVELNLDLANRIEVRLEDRDGYERLFGAIRMAVRDANQDAYEIEIDVPKATQTCVLVASEAAMPQLRRDVDLALEPLRESGMPLPKEVLELRPPPTARSVTAICAAEMLIGDCAFEGEPPNVAAAIAYQVGVAQALGKPTILLTDQPDQVGKALPNPVEAQSPRTLPTMIFIPRKDFGTALSDAIISAREAVAPNLLVDRSVVAIRVLDRVLRNVLPRLWPEFGRLLSFALETLGISHALLQDSRALRDLTEELRQQTRDQAGSIGERRRRMVAKNQQFKTTRDDQWSTWAANLYSNTRDDVSVKLKNIEANLPDGSKDTFGKAKARWGLLLDDVDKFKQDCVDLANHEATAFACLDTYPGTDTLNRVVNGVHESLCAVHDDANGLIAMLLKIVVGEVGGIADGSYARAS